MRNKEFKTTGKFYLPEYPDEQRYGELEISTNKIELSLSGGLKDLELQKTGKRVVYGKNDKPEYEKVSGQTLDGYATLLKNHFGRTQRWNSGLEYTKENFYLAIIGEKDFSDTKTIEFEEMRVRFVRLHDFICKSTIQASYTTKNNKPEMVTVSADLKNITLLTFKTKNYVIRCEADHKFTARSDHPLKCHSPLEEYLYLRIAKKKGKFDMDEAMEVITTLRNFFSFALRDALYPVEIIIRNVVPKKLKSSVKTNYLKSQIFLSGRKYEEIEKAKNYNYLFNASDLGNSIGDVLQKWIDSRKNYEEVHNNFFSCVYKRDQYLESIFLMNVIAIENFAKIALKAKLLKRDKEPLIDEIKKMRDHIQKFSGKEEVKKFLLDRLKYFEEDLSLKQMLYGVQEILPKYLKDKVGERDIGEIVSLRSAIAHGGVTTDRLKRASDLDLFWKVIRIAEVCLMKTIDLTDDNIQKYISRYY